MTHRFITIDAVEYRLLNGMMHSGITLSTRYATVDNQKIVMWQWHVGGYHGIKTFVDNALFMLSDGDCTYIFSSFDITAHVH